MFVNNFLTINDKKYLKNVILLSKREKQKDVVKDAERS